MQCTSALTFVIGDDLNQKIGVRSKPSVADQTSRPSPKPDNALIKRSTVHPDETLSQPVLSVDDTGKKVDP
jgi:hypothetical protein